MKLRRFFCCAIITSTLFLTLIFGHFFVKKTKISSDKHASKIFNISVLMKPKPTIPKLVVLSKNYGYAGSSQNISEFLVKDFHPMKWSEV